jgi:hypothetical protein
MKLIFVDDASGEQTLIWLFDLAQAREPGLESRRSAISQGGPGLHIS